MSKKRSQQEDGLAFTSLKKTNNIKNKEFAKKIINKTDVKKIVTLLKYELQIPFDKPLSDAQFQKLQAELNLYMANHAYFYEEEVVPMGDE